MRLWSYHLSQIRPLSLAPISAGDRKKIFFRKGGKAKETGNMSENGQRNYICFQTVGCLHNRYRLVHSWVSAMMLNVQSEDSFFTQGYNR